MSSLLLAAVLAAGALTPASLWDVWPDARFVTTPAPCLRHAELVERLQALQTRHRAELGLEEVGRSVEGRAIHLLTLGSGPRKILLWSQMHGDEPSATPALLDLADFLLSRREASADVRAILEGLTLLMVPMLNPDGAEPYERRNAQGIDVNRDALNLATPEGRLLKRLRDRYEPELGFNLHDQSRRATVGSGGALATISLLAVAGDPEGTLTPGRERSRRVCSAIAKALAPFVPEGIGRYDEDWSPRAFGDNLTAWGTPVVLIESGGLPPDRSLTELTRLNFVALLTAFSELARDDARSHDAAVYESLARNARNEWSDVVFRGARILQPALLEPYRADVAFDLLEGDRTRAACEEHARRGSRITEIGDARFMGAGRSVDVGDALLAPAFVVAARGLEAGEWLDGKTLDLLSRLGVGSLVWQVPAQDRQAAEARARELNRRGRTALVLAGPEAPLPPIVLEGSPEREATTLPEIDGVLASASPGEPLPLAELLARLTGTAARSRDAGIRVGSPASFVVLRAPRDAAADSADLTVERVILDGAEVAAAR